MLPRGPPIVSMCLFVRLQMLVYHSERRVLFSLTTQPTQRGLTTDKQQQSSLWEAIVNPSFLTQGCLWQTPTHPLRYVLIIIILSFIAWLCYFLHSDWLPRGPERAYPDQRSVHFRIQTGNIELQFAIIKHLLTSLGWLISG